MKKFLIISLTLISLINLSFFPGETTISIQEAVRNQKIIVLATSNGNHRGDAIKLEVKNSSRLKTRLLIPSGTVFHPEDNLDQDIIVTQNQYFVLNPQEDHSLVVQGYCSEMSDLSPSAGSAFTIGTTTNADLQRFCARVKSSSFPENTMQEAVWAMTDGEPVSQIYSENKAAGDELRKIVCDITGQKETWYEKKVNREVTEDRQIVGTPVEVTGGIQYVSRKGQFISAELWGPENTKLYDLGEPSPSPFTGTLTFNFNLSLEGFPKGKYKVLIKENKRVIKQQDFEV